MLVNLADLDRKEPEPVWSRRRPRFQMRARPISWRNHPASSARFPLGGSTATNLPKLSEEEITTKLGALKGWQRKGDAITKEVVCAGFTAATAFVAKIAPLADGMDHHPDGLIHRCKRVKITLWTHSAGGLTENDFDLATKIDGLV
jgi:4a-hydroxytetrahydrobiopterin dehydratase